MPGPIYGGQPVLADTSVWTALERAKKKGNVPQAWAAAIRRDQVWTSPIVRLELLHSTRNVSEFDEINERLSVFKEARITYSVALAAISALRELAKKAPEYHRVNLGDALIAASAQESSLAVLHYNFTDFQKLAEVLIFDAIPFGQPGEFEN